MKGLIELMITMLLLAGINNFTCASDSISINPSLSKSDSFIIKFSRICGDEIYSPHYYYNHRHLCRLVNDTLSMINIEGIGPRNRMKLFLADGKFFIELYELDCRFENKLKTVHQELILNKTNYTVGDTLIGHISCIVANTDRFTRFYFDSIKLSGKFNVIVRGEKFGYDSLNKQNLLDRLASLSEVKHAETFNSLTINMVGLSELPKGLIRFKNLDTLIIENADFSNTDLSVLGNFKKLKFLDITNSNIEEFPAFIYDLKHLETLVIYGIKVKEMPIRFSGLKNMKNLFWGGSITTVPEGIFKLEKLELLDIDPQGNSPQILPPLFFSKMKNLKKFMSNVPLDEPGYAEFLKKHPYARSFFDD